MHRIQHFVCALVLVACCRFAAASEYRGIVTFGGMPLRGVSITARQGAKTVTVVSDQDGAFKFDDLADGQWTIDVEMQCFEKIETAVTISSNTPAGAWGLKLLPLNQLVASAQTTKPAQELPQAPSVGLVKKPEGQQPAPGNAPTEIPKAPEQNEQSSDGFLVQGSVNNAATSQYSTNAAFGNTRSRTRGLYTGGVVLGEDNSTLDARAYSVSGVEPAKP